MNINLRTAVALVAGAALVAGITGVTAAPTTGGTSIVAAQPGGKARPAPAEDMKALGAAGSETLYVPITPCRIADTRKGGGKIAANAKRDLYVSGTSGFPAQGGTSGGCGIPAGATAATFSFTTLNGGGNGAISAWPVGATEPLAKMVSFTSSGLHTGTPAVAIASGSGKHLSVRSYSYSTNMVVDVTGYYVGQMHAYVNPNGTFSRSSRVASVAKVGVGVYNVTFDTPVSGCVGVASADYAGYTANVYPSGGAVMSVYVYNAAGVATDYYFNIHVSC